ncbi:MAG: protein ImuB [Cryomorphaceae bacterium]
MTKIGENTQGNDALHRKKTGRGPSKQPCEAWLCLRFTHLALNSASLALESQPAVAISYQQQIWQCNAIATQSAIQIGMSVNHALMLNPSIELHEREQLLEQQKLQELSYWAYRFTSLVSQYNEHSLLLEIGRSIKLFNGLSHLINLITNDLSNFKIEAQLGLADTPKAAYILSNSSSPNDALANSRSRLLNAAIEHLDIEPKTIAQLHSCGFEVLEDIDSVAVAELGQRFGASLLRYLDQLWGRVADPQIGTIPPEKFHASADFAEPISNLTWIQQQLERLLHDLAHFSKTRQLICRSFTWRFYKENNELLETISIALSAKQNSLATFEELSNLKLASIKLNWEFSSIELSSTQLVPIRLFNSDLFDPQPDQEQFKQLIDKFSSRLGHTALFRVYAESEHLPELANGRQHAVQETPATYAKQQERQDQNPAQQNKVLQDQPLWLLESPQRLAQQQSQPLYEGPLSIIHGPDRISSHWWAKLQSRDYFIARQRSGRLLWIYFDRSLRNWYLHGLFA